MQKLELALEVFKVYGGYAAGPELLSLLPPCDLRGHTVSLVDDPVMYTELILASVNDPRLPLALLNEALNRGITPYTVAINTLLAVGAGALVLHGAHASRGAVRQVLVKEQLHDTVDALFRRLRSRGATLNSQTYNYVLEAFVRHREEAVRP